MSQFRATRVRCEVFPDKVDQDFKVIIGESPKIYKATGVYFEFGFFAGPNQLYDISNMADLVLMAKPVGNPGAVPSILVTITDFNRTLTLEQWNQGLYHAAVLVTAAETDVAAAPYDLTLYGHTVDDGVNADVFGTSTLTIVDAGLSNIVAPAVGSSPALTVEMLWGILGNYITAVLKPGATITLVSPDGQHKRILGVDNTGAPVDQWEEV